jgi:hypothetical protein
LSYQTIPGRSQIWLARHRQAAKADIKQPRCG